MRRHSETDVSQSDPSRLESFSDAVFGILITIMVLGIRPPSGTNVSGVKQVIPRLLVYALSFTFLGIYWNNHHHLLRATTRISGWVMWANLHLLFWLSFIPIVTEWIGKRPGATWPAAFYGIVAAMSAIAYSPILSMAIVRANRDTALAETLRHDLKGKVSIVLYLAAIGTAFISSVFSFVLYVVVAVIWFIPDRRLQANRSDQ